MRRFTTLTCRTLGLVGGLLLIPIFLSSGERAEAWGSVDSWYETGGECTHRFILREAYRAISRDPAFDESTFPTLEDLIANEGVTLPSLSGAGPDGHGNSIYDEHFWNPRIAAGAAPASVARWTVLLAKARRAGKYAAGAKAAAYGAHYLADMCVPYHTNGMPLDRVVKLVATQGSLTSKQALLGPEIYGSIDHFFQVSDFKSPLPPNTLVAEAEAAHPLADAETGTRNFYKEVLHYLGSVASAEVNWFDPWLLDGNDDWPFQGLFDKTASHVLWEIKAYACHHPPGTNSVSRSERLRYPAYEPDWDNSPLTDFEDPWEKVGPPANKLAKSCAGRTAAKTDTYLKDIPAAIIDSVLAVATLWRSTMSALRPELTITIGAGGELEIRGEVLNVAHERAYELKARMLLVDGSGKVVRQEEVDVGKVNAKGSKTIDAVWHTPKLGDDARCRLEVIGAYQEVPDLQYAVQEVPLAPTLKGIDWQAIIQEMSGRGRARGIKSKPPEFKKNRFVFTLSPASGRVQGSWLAGFVIESSGTNEDGKFIKGAQAVVLKGKMNGKRLVGEGVGPGKLEGTLEFSLKNRVLRTMDGKSTQRDFGHEGKGTWAATIDADGLITGSIRMEELEVDVPFRLTIQDAMPKSFVESRR